MPISIDSEISGVLVVRPFGGLNDSLCQIEYARRIAKLTNRKLAVQTEISHSELAHKFGQSFESIFEFIDGTEVISGKPLIEFLTEARTIYPEVYISPKNVVDKSLSEITKGHNKSYRLEASGHEPYSVLVHESSGGGPLGALLLGRLKLTDAFKEKFTPILENLPKNSTGIHFRNGDYKSSYSMLSRVVNRARKNAPILLASDDIYAKEYILSRCKNNNVVYASDFIKKYGIFTDTELAIAEMMLLSMCRDLVLVALSKQHRVRYSGFGRLCKQVWAVRKLRTDGPIAFALSNSKFLGLGRRISSDNPIGNLLGSANVRSVLNQVFKPRGVYYQAIDFWRSF